MKTVLILMATFAFATAYGQKLSGESSAIEKTVKTYASAGDTHDTGSLQNVLHDNHRLVWHDGTKAPFLMDKTGYIAKIESKEWGGDKRKVEIQSVESFDGVNAKVKAILDGEKMQMRSIFSLIKVDGNWKIIEELVNASIK